MRTFVRALLDDVQALERMCANGQIESGIRRMGAEQELFLVDAAQRPTPLADPALEQLGEDFTVELGRFNLEANLSPHVLGGDCLGQMERELLARVDEARQVLRGLGGDVVLTGILPTLEKRHLTLDNMTQSPRFHELNKVLLELRGDEFHTVIKGVDELSTRHDNVMLEACNTSFQVHFQVGPEEFARLYNLAQAVTAPLLAAAVNSPLLLRHRLWKETRVALFQQSLDTRSEAHQTRGARARVTFGDAWVQNSVLELFKEDIARHRVVIASDLGESSLAMLERGDMPPLKALCLHNGTVYRWNRPCYGVKDNVAHLRIENRVLASGPTVVDEVANAAFFFGLMLGVGAEVDDVRTAMDFDDAKQNFMAAARYGLEAQFTWMDAGTCTARELILERLLPAARAGLASAELDPADVERYLGVVQARVEAVRTGAQWALDSLAHLRQGGGPGEGNLRDVHDRALVAAMIRNAESNRPVHEWELAEAADEADWRESYRTVGQFMVTDLFTVGPEDLIDLAASVMEWEHIRHVPVEDSEGRLVGLVSHRQLLRLVGRRDQEDVVVAVRDIMKPDVVSIGPDASSLEAMRVMRERRVGCLPVVQDDRLVGIITEHDFIEIARTLLEAELTHE